MKHALLPLLSLAAAFAPALRRNFSTANGAAEDVLAKLGISPDASEDVIAAAASHLNANDQSAVQSPADELNPGVLVIPPDVDKKDVLWRKRTGLSLAQAIQASRAQKQHDTAASKKA